MFGGLAGHQSKAAPVQIRRNKRWNIGNIYSEALEINGLRLFGGLAGGFERGAPQPDN